MEGRETVPLRFARRKPGLLLFVELRPAVDIRPEKLEDHQKRFRLEGAERPGSVQRRRTLRFGRRLQKRQILFILQYAGRDRRRRGCIGLARRTVQKRSADERYFADRPGGLRRRRRTGVPLLGAILGQRGQTERQHAGSGHYDDSRRTGH